MNGTENMTVSRKAVALKYEPERDRAPRVVARGERKLADKILELSQKSGVPIFEDEVLAELLYPLAPGEAIPKELYEPVAKILAYVIRFYRREG